MWYAEYVSKLERGMDRVGFADAMTIGVAQSTALFPGVSRSGITITAGLFRGMTREAVSYTHLALHRDFGPGGGSLRALKF